jgi:hypothetical protein
VPEHVRLRVQRGVFLVEAEGSQELVEKYVKDEIAEWGPTASTGVRAGGSAPAGTGAGTGQRLKEFAASKKPNGHLEIAATLAYWAKINEGVGSVNGTELEELYKRAEIKRPADATNTMAKAASQKGWFRNAGEGRYELTSTGEDHVVHDLPSSR